MKKLLLFCCLITSVTAFGQYITSDTIVFVSEDGDTLSYYHGKKIDTEAVIYPPLNYALVVDSILNFAPTTLCMSGSSDGMLSFILDGDSLIIECVGMELSEGARIFIDYIKRYVPNQIDSLERELEARDNIIKTYYEEILK